MRGITRPIDKVKSWDMIVEGDGVIEGEDELLAPRVREGVEVTDVVGVFVGEGQLESEREG